MASTWAMQRQFPGGFEGLVEVARLALILETLGHLQGLMGNPRGVEVAVSLSLIRLRSSFGVHRWPPDDVEAASVLLTQPA